MVYVCSTYCADVCLITAIPYPGRPNSIITVFNTSLTKLFPCIYSHAETSIEIITAASFELSLLLLQAALVGFVLVSRLYYISVMRMK